MTVGQLKQWLDSHPDDMQLRFDIVPRPGTVNDIGYPFRRAIGAGQVVTLPVYDGGSTYSGPEMRMLIETAQRKGMTL